MKRWLEEHGCYAIRGRESARHSYLRNGSLLVRLFHTFSLIWHWRIFCLSRTWFALRFFVGGGDNGREIGLCLALPFVGLGVAINLPFAPRFREEYETGICAHQSLLWLRFLTPIDPPQRRQLTIHLDDVLMGRESYHRTLVDSQIVGIAASEAVYSAHARLYNQLWKRRRWPIRRHGRIVEIEIDAAIPIRSAEGTILDIETFVVPAVSILEGVAECEAYILRRRAEVLRERTA